MFFKKREQKPTPPWVLWAVVAFLAFAMIGNQREGSEIQQSIDDAAKNLSPSKLVDVESYRNLVLPDRTARLRVKDTEPGRGTLAVCGQKIAIAYESFLADDKPTGDKAGKDKPLTFRIGEGKVMPVFEQGVTGMKEGGKRSLLAPSHMAYGAKEFARDGVPMNAQARFDVELLEARPTLPDLESTPYRIADTARGAGQIILCGDAVKVRVMLWDMAGKQLYSGKDKEPLSFTPGKSEVFLGLEQGVIGMRTGGERMLVVPPSFQKTMDGNKPIIDFPLPKNEIILVDVVAVE